MSNLSPTSPPTPCYAVIFTSVRTASDPDGYEAMAERMVERAAGRPGFLGVESVRGADGFGITVSYWASEEAVRAWQQDAEHLEAQHLGRKRWYEHFSVRVARVERAWTFTRPQPEPGPGA